MTVITIGTKNQIVIPKEVRKKIKGLRPGAKVVVTSLDNQTITIRKADESWVERTRGLMKKEWKDIDTTAYLEELRNSWDEK